MPNDDQIIRLNGRLTFDPNDIEEVARICEVNATDARDHPGMVEYSFWVNDAHDEIYIHEQYESDEALVNHLGNMNEAAVTRLLELVQLGTMECAAKRTEKTAAALGAFGVPINFYEPLHRH